MAGLVLHVGPSSGRQSVEAGLNTMGRSPGQPYRYLGGDGNAHIGVAARHKWEFDCHRDTGSGTHTVVFGFPLTRRGGWRRLSADRIFEEYSTGGVPAIAELDGSFVVAVVDTGARKAVVVNDATGSVPMFWARTGSGIAFAPQGKAILAILGMPAAIDDAGLLQFMNTGHPYGERTLLGGVHRLRPAECAEIDLDGLSLKKETYWKLPPAGDNRPYTLRAAADELFEVVGDSHDAVAALGLRDIAVALTGGYDSRVVLSLLALKGLRPLRSFTWGTDEGIAGSDPAVARRLAADFGSTHDFRSFNAGTFPDRVSDWVETSELLSDNAGYCAAGLEFLADLPLPDVVLTGDHIIGLGALPSSIAEAVEAVTTVPPSGVSAVLSNVLSDEARLNIREEFRSGIMAIVNDAPDAHPKAVQDFLYHQIHAPGWLFSPGFFKEPAVAAFRPLMLRPVLETVARMPYRFRSDKIVLVQMLKRNLKLAAKAPVASAFSLIDWGYEAVNNDRLRFFLEKQTSEEAIAGSPLNSLIDMDSFRLVRSQFFEASVPRISRSRTYVPVAMEIRRLLAQHSHLRKIARSLNQMAPKGVVGRPKERSHRAVFRLLSRVAQVTLFQGALNRLSPSGSLTSDHAAAP